MWGFFVLNRRHCPGPAILYMDFRRWHLVATCATLSVGVRDGDNIIIINNIKITATAVIVVAATKKNIHRKGVLSNRHCHSGSNVLSIKHSHIHISFKHEYYVFDLPRSFLYVHYDGPNTYTYWPGLWVVWMCVQFNPSMSICPCYVTILAKYAIEYTTNDTERANYHMCWNHLPMSRPTLVAIFFFTLNSLTHGGPIRDLIGNLTSSFEYSLTLCLSKIFIIIIFFFVGDKRGNQTHSMGNCTKSQLVVFILFLLGYDAIIQFHVFNLCSKLSLCHCRIEWKRFDN